MLEIQIKNFQDPVFQNKIFDRYEETLVDLEKRIKIAEKSNDKSSILQLLRLKTTVLKDQLKASMIHYTKQDTQQEVVDTIASLANVAWEDENDKVQ